MSRFNGQADTRDIMSALSSFLVCRKQIWHVLVEALMRICQANAQQNFENHWLAVNLSRLE
jgi:hypothetical protein